MVNTAPTPNRSPVAEDRLTLRQAQGEREKAVNGRRARGGSLLPLVLLLTACPPAHVATAALVEKDQLTQTLTDAELAWSHRPDVAEVRRSVSLALSAALSDQTRTEGDIGVIRGVAWLVEHGVKEDRGTLVATALAAGDRCVARAPNTPCEYWQTVARGLGARENPSTGLRQAFSIAEALHRLQATQPRVEDGGPSRMLTLLLLRAPGWPLGPGDADAALVEAQKALALNPGHPLNHLVLAEALVATGDPDGAKAAYLEAKRLAQQRAAAGDPDGADWAAQAERGLERL